MKQTCRTCNELLTTHTGITTDEKPKPKDFSVCLYCATISKYDNDLNLVPVSNAELHDLEGEFSEIYEVLKDMRSMILSIKTN